MNRRDCLGMMAAVVAVPRTAIATPHYAPVVSGLELKFPDDEGSHPEFRTEWWYVTGWLNTGEAPVGFQVTFFRTRPHPDSGNPSRFDPREIIIAHAALSERSHGRLRHAQRIARAGFGIAEARKGSTDIKLDDWRLHSTNGGYRTLVQATDFGVDLMLRPAQSPLLQGDNGYSRKGPTPSSASYYYSMPHLAVAGTLRREQRIVKVQGTAWFDHEWSSEYLDPEASGWDWIGVSLDDGSALMAFRMRNRNGMQHWAAATFRTRNGERRTFTPREVAFMPKRLWRSPRTGADYPVAMRVQVGDTIYDVEPMFDDQENDTRLSTGAVYWEGAVTLNIAGRRVGAGYLELTGYAGKLRL